MKGLKISCVLFVLIIMINVALVKYVDSAVNSLCCMADAAYEDLLYSGEFDKENIIIMRKKLDDTLPVMRIIVNHNETDEIESCLNRIYGAYEAHSCDALIYLEELRFHVGNVAGREKLSTDNIL